MRTRPFLPRPEYPRPDRQRGFVNGVDWFNLNGAWEFRFDPNREGLEQEWFRLRGKKWSEQIIVPFCWESLGAWGQSDAAGNDNFFSTRVFKNPLDVDRLNYRNAERYEIGWYRRYIRVPLNEHWIGKRVILNVGAADFYIKCWCNEQFIGEAESGYIPCEFDITDALESVSDQELKGVIVFQVEDPMHNNEQPVGKQWGWYSSVSGIWQTVYLEPRARTFIERFEVFTDIVSEEALFNVYVTGGSSVDLEVSSPSGQIYKTKLVVSNNCASGVLSVKPVVLWDPNNPKLYRFKMTLKDDQYPDVVHGYFGMRSLFPRAISEDGGPGVLYFNGEPIYIRGALYQSYHTEGIYTAGNVQALQDDIIFAKRMGFDLLRVHVKVDDPLLLYYADTIGILLMADFPNFGEGGDTPVARRRYEETMRKAIQRDFNHPSIVAWCLFNETWGFGGLAEFVKLINPLPPRMGTIGTGQSSGMKLANEDAYEWIQSMWNLAKALDGTRLIEDMSVVAWEHLKHYGHGETDVNSWHFYSNNYLWARAHIAEVVEKTYSGSTYNYLPGFQQHSQPLIASEYGGVGALDGDVDVSWSFKFLTNELRLHSRLSAYIYTELHDVEWERNGFLNYDRTPKVFGYDPLIVNQGDVLPIDAPPISRRHPGEQVAVKVYASHFSRQPRENVTLFWRLSGIDSLGWTHEDLASGENPIPFTQYKVELAKIIELRMPLETMVCTLWVRAVTLDGTVVARNYIQFFVDKGVSLEEEIDGCLILKADPSTWSFAEWSDGFSTRGEAQAAGFCFGSGYGHFDWEFLLDPVRLQACSRLRILCEASAFRLENPQTDAFGHSTIFTLHLNGVPVFRSILPNHPHDAGGALSYLREGRGAYGYLIQAIAEGAMLEEIKKKRGNLCLSCTVPRDEGPHGGVSLYGYDCGRYPIGPTLIVE